MAASSASRADIFLVAHGYARTRAEAQEAIAAGKVFDGGRPVLKPSQRLNESARIEYERAHPFVSRGALKLAAALNHFALSPYGLACLDLGASTGGFTEILLMHGARRVFAVDVGHGQLDPKLIADARVVSIERTNARDLSPEVVSEPPLAVTADLSFISLKLALPASLALAVPGAWLIALVKPQFEAGRARIGKGGIVRDPAVHRKVLDDIVAWISSVDGWNVQGTVDSPVQGGDGNREFLLAARKS